MIITQLFQYWHNFIVKPWHFMFFSSPPCDKNSPTPHSHVITQINIVGETTLISECFSLSKCLKRRTKNWKIACQLLELYSDLIEFACCSLQFNAVQLRNFTSLMEGVLQSRYESQHTWLGRLLNVQLAFELWQIYRTLIILQRNSWQGNYTRQECRSEKALILT